MDYKSANYKESGNLLAAMTADRFAAEDAARKAYLDAENKKPYIVEFPRCRLCRTRISRPKITGNTCTHCRQKMRRAALEAAKRRVNGE